MIATDTHIHLKLNFENTIEIKNLIITNLFHIYLDIICGQ